MNLIATAHPAYAVAGLVVGFMVGLTGVGGGSLMTPILVLVFGVRVTTAVGTDLLFAAVTKTVGVAAHGWSGNVDWLITRRLAIGSLPAAALTIAALYVTRKSGHAASPLIQPILGGALIATAICLFARRWLDRIAQTQSGGLLARRPAVPTIAIGAIVGALVASSSVGSGAIGMSALILLYPRVPLAKLVGSDIAHAVPLTLLSGFGYWLLGAIDWSLLGPLLLGSLPGVVIGSRLAAWVPDRVLRPLLAVTLGGIGIRMFR